MEPWVTASGNGTWSTLYSKPNGDFSEKLGMELQSGPTKSYLGNEPPNTKILI